MEDQKAVCIPTPWYHHHEFALLPNIKIREADQHNTRSIRFHWLVFRAWTMDNPAFGIEVAYDSGRFEARVRFPYLITGLFIRVLPWQWDYVMWRKPKREREK